MTTEFKQMLERLDLHEIDKLKKAKQAITYLEGKRKSLQAELATVDEHLAGLKDGSIDPQTILPKITGGTPALPSTPRHRQTGESLSSKIIAVLQGKTDGLKVTEIAAAVLAAGYQTNSQNFRVIVGITAGKMPEVERIAHGVYRLKA